MNEIDSRLYGAGRRALYSSYDQDFHLLVGERGANVHAIPGATRVHTIRESLQYAALLLASPEGSDCQRAEDIIRAALAAQDREPDSDLRGVFRYYLEDDWDKITYPDRNWADFCGTWLLVSGKRFGDRLSEECLDMVRDSLREAAGAIRRRDMGAHYTNIAALGTFVTLVGGEWLGDEDLRAYGFSRFAALQDHVNRNGGSFEEYNSPTYSRVTMTALLLLRWLDPDTAVRDGVEDLLDLLWESVSLHYHPATGQLAGPHSRAYPVVGLSSLHPVFYKITRGELGGDPDGEPPKLAASGVTSLIPVYCPDRAKERLFSRIGSRTVHEVVRVDEGDAGSAPPGRFTQLTSYLTGSYCIGTASRAVMWDQRRPLLAYWKEGNEVGYLRARFLRDGSDFCSGRLFCVQDTNRVLAAATMVAGADSHVSFPVEEFEASQLGLAFDIFHGSSPVRAPSTVGLGEEAPFDCGEVKVSIAPVACTSGGSEGECVLEEHPGLLRVRMDVYRGPPRSFRWSDWPDVGIAAGVAVCRRIDPDDIAVEASGDSLDAAWNRAPRLQLSIDTRVVERDAYPFCSRATVGGEPYGPWPLRGHSNQM
jgi:hypothetical protein